MLDTGRRPSGRLCYWMLAVVAASGFWVTASGAAPVPQSGPASTTVADTVFLADGTTAQGNLIITWPAFVTASGTAVAGGTTNVTLGANGALSVALVPNAGATPAGVYYTVVYQIGAGEVKTEYWVVPTTSPANLALVRTTPGSGAAGQPVSLQYVNSELATKANDSAVVHLSGSETISGSKTFGSAPNVPAPTGTGQVANKAYVDQSVANVGAGNFLPTAGGTLTGPLTLPGNPAAPLQATPKQYVDLGFTTKADLITGLVPANELGTGTATSGTCLLGNGTWGGCGSGTGNVSTNPSSGISQNITQAAGTQFSTNNLAGIPYVVASYNWPQAGAPAESCSAGCTSGALVAGTQATMTLTPCPAGIDTSNNGNAPYGVYIAGTGTAEATAVTGGSCTSGAASGTIVFTPANAHAAGFVVGAANGGNQEAINVATAGGSTHAVIQEVPTGGADAANYSIYWPVFLKATKSLLNGDGAFWSCYTRATCLMVGNYAGNTGLSSVVKGLEFQSGTNVGGAQISSVSAASGLYTVNTAGNHNLMTGDWVIFNYSVPAQTQEARVKVTVTSATQFQFTLGATTFALSSGFGWVAIENAAIEVETDGVRLQDIRFNQGVNGGLFHQGVVVGNDQRFIVDGMTTLGWSNEFRCDANICGNVLFFRGDQGMAPVAYLHHLELSMQCGGNGIRNSAGNTMKIADSVIQGFNQYGVYYANGLQSAESDNVYQESGYCVNPAYPANGGNSQLAQAGYIINGPPFTIQGNAPTGGVFPVFATGGTCSSVQRNYYVVAHDTNLGTSPMLYFGYACPATSGTSVPLAWPNPDLAGSGTRTFDILATVGTGVTTAPNGTGNYAITGMVGISATCGTSGICTATDTQPGFSSYTVFATPNWAARLPFWPASVVLGSASALFAEQVGQSAAIISTSYLPRIFAKRCVDTGNPASYTPFWVVCPAGDSVGSNNSKVGAYVVQLGWASGLTGVQNFNVGGGALAVPQQIITTFDGNPTATLATAGYRRTGTGADSFIGTDTSGNAGTQDQTYGAPGGHNFYVNDPGTNSTHAKFNIAASSATLNVPLTVNGNLAVTSGSVTVPITGSVQCLHASSTGVVTGTGADCGSGGGGGSGTVNSGAASQVAMYSGSGAAVSGDSALTDSGTVLNYAGSGGMAATSGTFSGNLTVGGQLILTGPWVVDTPIPGSAMGAAATGTSSIGISSDGNFYISANGGTPQQITAGGSAVASVFGRTGAVTAQSGDYSVAQVTGAAPLASPSFTGTVTEPVPTLPSQTSNYFFAAPAGSAGSPSFRAMVASDIPTLNQNTTGTAVNLSGTPALPNGTTGTTQSVGDSSAKLATDAFVAGGFAAVNPVSSLAAGDYAKGVGSSSVTDSGVLAGPYPVPWITAVRGGGSATFSQNVVKMWGVVLTYPLTTTSVAYSVTVDNTANLYDIGIACAMPSCTAGTILLDTGATAGTTFSPSAGVRTLNWSQGTKTLQPGKYYVVFTTNCASACATIAAGGSSGDITFQNAATAGTTSGGALASFTAPADVWSWGANVPALVVK